jgi:two-component system, LytTR family, response regulator LytT
MRQNPDPAIIPSRRLAALVVEDEWTTRNYLVELIESSKLAEVVGAVSTVAEAHQVLRATPGLSVDVVFVDVRLEGDRSSSTGMDLIRSMNESAQAPMFVLATVFAQHALEAFELGVVDYLLKPFNEERVALCLSRVLQRITIRAGSPATRRVVARRKRTLVFLEPTEIWAFEAADRLTYVHSLHGKFDIDLSLSAIEASFGRTFVRVHRNWLINLAQVRELERESGETTLFVGLGTAETSEGIHVPVSRERAQTLREQLLASATGVRHN